MARRVGPGPVFIYESLIFARWRQVYASRALFVLAILVGLWILWWNSVHAPGLGQPMGSRPDTLQALARAGVSFFYALAGIQLSMVLVVAPAATAGALCQDRARGVLAQMATTDLSDSEIVLGKLFSRLAPVLALLACALPVVAMAALLGGIDGRALVGLFAVSVAVAVLGCSLSLSLSISIEVQKTEEVVMAVLAFTTCWLLSLPLWKGLTQTYGVPPPPDWFYATNPFVLVFAPYTWPGHFGLLEVAIFVAGALAISAGLLARTIARLRRFVLPAEVGRRKRKLRAPALWLTWLRARMAAIRKWRERLPGPSLDGNPVLWREWHRSRPSRMARILWVVYWLGAVAATVMGIHDVFAYGYDNTTGGFMIRTALVLPSVLGLMLLCVQAPSALGEERVRGSLDVLMTAPISTREIVWGKWMGTYRLALGMAIVPGIAAAVIAAVCADVFPARVVAVVAPTPIGPIDRVLAPVLVVAELLSWGAVFTSLGLLLATWSRRIGRAIGISLAVFLLLSFGWIFLAFIVVLPAMHTWLDGASNIEGIDLIWIDTGLVALSPMAAPITTIQVLESADARRWQFWLIMSCWCLLAWACAGAMYWVALRSFDRRLGRMRETSQGARAIEPHRLVAVGGASA
jgi:ABC-type transport system involved in multi-copper enzyme maturation permease subunit